MKLIILALLSLALCGCKTSTPKYQSLGPALPPLPPSRLPSARAMLAQPSSTETHTIQIEWQAIGPVEIRYSTNLITWDHWADSTNSSLAVTASGQSQYFKVVAQNSVTFAWDNPPLPVGGWRVFVGPSSGTYTNSYDAGQSTSFALPLAPGSTIYCAVQAYNGTLFSDLSEEIAWTASGTWITPVPMRIRVY